jgi:hypothetical protein
MAQAGLERSRKVAVPDRGVLLGLYETQLLEVAHQGTKLACQPALMAPALQASCLPQADL